MDESITPDPERFINPAPDTSEESEWVTDEEVEALSQEREILGDDYVAQAEKILLHNLPAAVHSIAKLSRTSENPTVRLNAAKYIVDRNLGKIVEPAVAEDDPIKKLLEGVTVG